ncbi:MAG: gephyrin-like molybdotransferase Glp [Candidatus Latescibacterota bacterium]|nr:gephyrin-like molybdotransferase Glp [Candidatus Latescibacterota bacterium]
MIETNIMHTVEQARTAVLEHIGVAPAERVALILDGLGRVLAEDVSASYDNPPHDNSAMDGFAVRWEDVKDATPEAPVSLIVIEDIPAGKVPEHAVGDGQASRIMTGAPLPAAADTVIIVEDTVGDGTSTVQILEAEDEPGANVRCRGEDMKCGEMLLTAGTELGPGEIGVIAAVQKTWLAVRRRPTVAVLSTGDELVEVDEPLEPGKIVNSNTPAIGAMARACGAKPVLLPTARDDEATIRAAIESALACDLIVSSGGVSVGDYDFVKKVLDDLRAEEVLWRVAMKPGRPLYFCMLQGKPYFGLPGNPVSSLMSFLQFVRPALRKASGYTEGEWLLPEAPAVMEHEVGNPGSRRSFLRARLRRDAEGRLQASTAHRAQGSHILTSMLGANGVVMLDPEAHVATGEEVRVQLLGDVY